MTELEILRESGLEDVATVFCARLRGRDACAIELVDGLESGRPRAEKWIVNISTQFGCPVACRFCDAGGGYAGDLTVDEMLAEVRFVLARHPQFIASCPKLKVHLARIGEPSLNDAVPDAVRAIRSLTANPGLWCCLPTVVPQGRRAWFHRLKDAKNDCFPGRFQLQFSLNSTDEATRRRLMPVDLEDFSSVATIGDAFFAPGDRRVVLNFALAEDFPFDPSIVRRFFDPCHFAVKLTPLNPTLRSRRAGLTTLLRGPGAKQAEEAAASLQADGYDVILSIGDPREDQLGSNCGQSLARLGIVRLPDPLATETHH